MLTEDEKANIKYRLSDIGVKVLQLSLEYIDELEKENAGLKKNLDRYSQKIAEQEETIDSQDDKINFYVAKMNENILKRQELEKENEQLECDLYNTNANLQHITIEYENEIAELKKDEQIEKMKCCQMCKHLQDGGSCLKADKDDIKKWGDFLIRTRRNNHCKNWELAE